MQRAVPVGTVGVFGVEPVTLDHKFCHIAAGIILMSQNVGAYLAQDTVSGADTLDTFLHKGVAEVLLTESDQPVVGFQQVRDDNVPVVIAIQIFYPENGVRFVLRQYR